jgi:hypothetical protein
MGTRGNRGCRGRNSSACFFFHLAAGGTERVPNLIERSGLGNHKLGAETERSRQRCSTAYNSNGGNSLVELGTLERIEHQLRGCQVIAIDDERAE